MYFSGYIMLNMMCYRVLGLSEMSRLFVMPAPNHVVGISALCGLDSATLGSRQSFDVAVHRNVETVEIL